MVEIFTIGVLGIQGAISEHISALKSTFQEENIRGKAIVVKKKEEIDTLDALIIPGGESTTISRVLQKSGLFDAIHDRLKEKNLPVMGTCAGCILLSKEIIDDKMGEVQPFQAMDMHVERNAFGRQRESFEQEIDFIDFSEPYHAVFIRAPVITKIWGECKTLSKIDKKVIAARQENYLALSFHPELTDDIRIHRYFLEMI